jgi:hypothetical protein
MVYRRSMIDATSWVDRPHRGPRAEVLVLAKRQRDAVEAAIRPAKAEKRIVLRGEAVLLMVQGVGPNDVARILGVHPRTVWRWKKRFGTADDVVSQLADAPRSGRPPSLSPTPTRPG